MKRIVKGVAFMSLSIDKAQNIESVAFISRCKYVTSRCNYVTQCYTITYPLQMENDPPPVENES